MAATKKKAAKRKTKGCNCVEECNKTLRKDKDCELETSFCIDFETGEVSVDGPFLKVRRCDGAKGRKKLPTIACSYCPICGRKKT